LAKSDRFEKMKKRHEEVEKIMEQFNEIRISPKEIDPILEKLGGTPLKQQMPLSQIITRPEIGLNDLMEIQKVREILQVYSNTALDSAEIEQKYKGYIQKEQDIAQKAVHLENLKIPETFDYSKLTSMSTEARQKLLKIQPKTLGQAKRISGINPSDIAILMVYIGR
jgi:tRNA uridine 5-carboxymethylaminomethyl modification enzyme